MRVIQWDEFKELADDARGGIDRIFLHWSGGHYDQPFADYHVNINGNGLLYCPVMRFTDYIEHTWQNNRRAMGITLLCCVDANTDFLGDEPPTQLQIEIMAMIVAYLCSRWDIPIDYSQVRTHAEQADLDGYGPATTCERWDLWFLNNEDVRGSGGDIIRGKANWYQKQFEFDG